MINKKATSPEDHQSRPSGNPNDASSKKPSNWLPQLYGFGGLILLIFLVQTVSGLYLALFFQPTPGEAWKSITFIENNVPLGDFFWSLHRWGALAAVPLIMLHVLHLFWREAYWKSPGAAWLSGVLLLLFLLAFMISGYLSHWDFRAYWATLTMLNWRESLPLFSGALGWLLSASSPGDLAPVARWYSLHVVFLPLLF
jgi:quinol-cytochrome oxidoreductase complex cytochrome b subunit